MHRVVGEDCSLVRYDFVLAECIVHALFLSCGLRQRRASSRSGRHPSRGDAAVTNWHSLGDHVDGAARDLCEDNGKTLTAKGEAERSAPYVPHFHAQSVAYLLSSLRELRCVAWPPPVSSPALFYQLAQFFAGSAGSVQGQDKGPVRAGSRRDWRFPTWWD